MKNRRRLAAAAGALIAAQTAVVDAATTPVCAEPPVPSCEAAAPPVAAPRGFRHRRSALVAALGRPNHRGRDLLIRPGDRQIAIAKLAYGAADKDLVDEEVDVLVLRGCQGTWEHLGTALTTDDGDHPDVEGVADTGGRIYFDIPRAAELGPGRHRIHLSVAGDRTSADLVIQVAPAGAPIALVDIDGTLTRRGSAELVAVLTATTAQTRPGAPAAIRALADRGYLPVYLTARPEPLVGRTRRFLGQHGFPAGLVITTTGKSGAIGGASARFKTSAIRAILDRGYVPAFAFGNTAGDAEVYAGAAVPNRFSLGREDPFGGRRFETYGELIAELSAAPCPWTSAPTTEPSRL